MTDNNSTTSTENPSELSAKVSLTDDSKTQTVQDKSDETKSTELKTENRNEDELTHGNQSVSNLDSNNSSEVTDAQVLNAGIKSDPTDLTQQNPLNSEAKQITNDNTVSENNVDSPLVHQVTNKGSDPSSEEPKPMEINDQPSLSESTTENIPNNSLLQGLSTINNNNNGSQPMDLEGTGDVVSTPDPTSEGNEESEQELDEDTSDPTTREEVAKTFQQTIKNDRLQSYATLTYNIDQSESWLDLQFHNQKSENGVVKPEEIKIPSVSTSNMNEELLNRIKGSMIGMALGDALGAHVEFRPHAYLEANPVKGLGSGGTWGLKKGQFTDDTSMALCLANSLIVCQDFVPYDQLVRYKWWYEYGYMSSTGSCFDIGNATRESVVEFTRRQQNALKNSQTNNKNIDYPPNDEILKDFNVYCSSDGVAGNGALMRLAPVPLFFFRSPKTAVEYSGISGQITHGDQKSYDACRYYGALIVAALNGYNKVQLLDDDFYSKHTSLFNDKKLHEDIEQIARGSYKRKNGYEGGIRGTGYIVNALEAALWAFHSTKSFKDGALAAVNLGDDTDTTAAIYGQLAGAYYGYKKLPKQWTKHVYAREFLEKLSECIAYEGDQWYQKKQRTTAE